MTMSQSFLPAKIEMEGDKKKREINDEMNTIEIQKIKKGKKGF